MALNGVISVLRCKGRKLFSAVQIFLANLIVVNKSSAEGVVECELMLNIIAALSTISRTEMFLL
ncbi:hypothetical protein D1638_02730 [Muribaculaceae bacterium Z1]|nr:hypothetical protein [Muribaculaceae bacterium S4]NBI19832.1 hypothetical protein [Muribaculaceae bacterium Z1]